MRKLGFGLMRLPVTDKDDQSRIDLKQLKKMADIFVDHGFTYFDTAYMYHENASEKAVKKAIVARYPRDSFLLATKLPTMFLKEEGDQERVFAEQLAKCGVDYFDYYLLHNLNAENYATAEKFGSFGFVAELKRQGKIRHMGFSFHDTAELLDRILSEHPETEFVQLQINYLDWDDPEIQSRKCYETAVRHGKKVVVMEPVKGGTLTKLPEEAAALLKSVHPDWTYAGWALRFVAGLDGVMVVLSGMSNTEQMLDSVSFMSDCAPLTEEELALLGKVTKLINEQKRIGCTACRYCTEGCPSNIAIPEYFALYNACVTRADNLQNLKAQYKDYTRDFGAASRCIKCRSCESACPQHLPVTDLLEKVAERFER